jgi:hypothetical protein
MAERARPALLLAALLAGPACAGETAPKVDEPGKLPAPPPSAADAAYDARLMDSFAAASSFQGPLDGGWRVAAQSGDLYELQLVDKPGGLEGAWRDLRRGRDPDGSGLIETAERTSHGVLLRFAPPNQPIVVLAFGGDLNGVLDRGGQRTQVTLRRIAP